MILQLNRKSSLGGQAVHEICAIIGVGRSLESRDKSSNFSEQSKKF